MVKRTKYILMTLGVIVVVGLLVATGFFVHSKMEESSAKKAETRINKLALATAQEAPQARTELMKAYDAESSTQRKHDYALAIATDVKKTDPIAALSWYEKAAAAQPDGYTYKNLGTAALKLGQKDKAAVSFRKTLELMKNEERNEEELSIVRELLAEAEK